MTSKWGDRKAMIEKSVSVENLISAPCQIACPAGVDVPRYIRLIKKENFDEALAVIRERIPFPSICGLVCNSPCESHCTNRHFGESVAIRALKRYAAEKGGERWRKNLAIKPLTGKKVAVVGSGPSGLTAAWYLAVLGHKATVFESADGPGGMMRKAIPAYRLPKAVLDREIDYIKELGVEIKTRTRIDAIDRLFKEGCDAVYLACGLPMGAKLGIKGEDLAGVINGIDFLKNINEGHRIDIGVGVAVIGGGNTAVDAARCALRTGAKEVSVIYRRSPAEMTAYETEVHAAKLEGVKIEFLMAPVCIDSIPDGLEITLIRMELGDFDGSGRRRPVPIEQSEFKRKVNTVITAVGQVFEGVEFMGVGLTKENLVKVDINTLETDRPGVFAGGDLVTGPASIIHAIAHGRKAAASIDKFLGGDGRIDQELALPEDKIVVKNMQSNTQTRQPMPCLPVAERTNSFQTVELGLSEESAIKEAGRCKDCDARQFEVIVHGEGCKECGYCMEVCEADVFGPADEFNEKGYRPIRVKQQERCVGCELCFYACPDFSIDVREIM